MIINVVDEVRAFIKRLSPESVFNDRIAERLPVFVRQHANHKTRELAGIDGFERRTAICSLYSAEKLVIRGI